MRHPKAARALLSAALCATAAAAPPPLAVRVPGALRSEDLAAVRRLEDTVLRDLGDEAVEHRSFGAGAGSQRVLFLHEHLEGATPALHGRLRELAVQASATAGWGLVQGDTLRNRCAELILYRGAGQPSSDSTEKIDWHNDGVTMVTLAVMLSEEGSYSGGAIRLRGPGWDGVESHSLKAGDALAWRGWTEHDVETVWFGDRQVLVTEWWFGPDAAQSGRPRMGDLPQLTRQALELDPAQPLLHYLHGRALCRRLPCEGSEAAEGARASFLRAIELGPGEESSLSGLGFFLLGGSFADWLQGVAYLHEACVRRAEKAGAERPAAGAVRAWLRWGGGRACWLRALETSAATTMRNLLRPQDAGEEEEAEEEEETLARATQQLRKSLCAVVVVLALTSCVGVLERLDRGPGPSGPRTGQPGREGEATATS